MGIQTTATNLVPSRFGDQRFTETGNHRTYQHDGTPQAGTFLQELIAFEISQIYIFGLKAISINAFLCNRHSHLTQELNQVVDIQNVRYIVHRHFLFSQQRSADDLQNFVFGTLRMNLAAEPVSSFDYK